MMNNLESSKCYVCLDETGNFISSPCECSTLIHQKCFDSLHNKKSCTICKSDFTIIVERSENIENKNCCKNIKFINNLPVCLLFVFSIGGLISFSFVLGGVIHEMIHGINIKIDMGLALLYGLAFFASFLIFVSLCLFGCIYKQRNRVHST